MDQLKRDVLAILMALAEADGGMPIPRTVLYLAMNGQMGRFAAAERFLVTAGMVTATAETVTLTERGRAAGELINQRLGA